MTKNKLSVPSKSDTVVSFKNSPKEGRLKWKPTNFLQKKTSAAKRRQSEAAVNFTSFSATPSSKTRKISIESFRSLDLNELEKVDAFFEACAKGNASALEALLLEDSELVSKQDKNGKFGLHHAACQPNLTVAQTLKSFGANVNCKDNEHNTPLHLAVEFGTVEMAALLLSFGACGTAMNKNMVFPLHQAVVSHNTEMVKVLLQFPDQVDINQVGRANCTALHWATKLDLSDCASLLVGSPGCDMTVRCRLKYTPLHWAAKCSADKTLRAIFEANALAKSCMEIPDRERNTTLHLAVDSGHLESVLVCLEFGGRVDAVQDNGSTALHLACSQGYLPMVRALFEAHARSNTEHYRQILSQKDVLGMTPLHRAAVFDHSTVAEYLLEQGPEVLNEVDNELRTPLLASAVRGASNTFFVLLNAGANCLVNDNKLRNILHYLVIHGHGDENTMSAANMICSEGKNIGLLNQKDSFGYTPLHMATMKGYVRFTEALIELGALLNSKDLKDQSPLHFAARNGRFNTVCRLLDMPSGQAMINESDREGMTPLMLACANGHSNVAELLLQRGAMIHRDFLDRTVLHLAAQNGHIDVISKLLAFHSNLLDQSCKVGMTALHYAASTNQSKTVAFLLSRQAQYVLDANGKTPLDVAVEQGASESATEMVKHARWKEVMLAANGQGQSAMVLLVRFMPEVAEIVLDQSVTFSQENSHAVDYWQKFDFRFIHNANGDKEKKGNDYEEPLPILNTMVRYRRVDLLSHPLTLNYLSVKWFTYGYLIFLFNILTYMFFAAVFTNGVIIWHADLRNKTKALEAGRYVLVMDGEEPKIKLGVACRITLSILLIFCLINMAKEIFQIYCNGLAYFRDLINYMEWGLYISALIFTEPLFSADPLVAFNWPVASLALFLAWFNILFFLQRVDNIGIYIIMFRQILQTVIKVLLVFTVLFVAFGLAFFILLWNNDNPSFSTPLGAVLQSVMFTMGEFEYSSNFLEPQSKGRMPYPTVTYTFLVIFVIIASLLLVNLLIGLSIGDIEAIQRNAAFKRLTMQVNYHTDVEKRLPKGYLARINRENAELLVHPNSCTKTIMTYLFKNLFGRKYHLVEKKDEAEYEETIESKLEDKINRMHNQLNCLQNTMKLIVQKLEIVSETYDHDEDLILAPIIKANNVVHKNAMEQPKHSILKKKKQSVPY